MSTDCCGFCFIVLSKRHTCDSCKIEPIFTEKFGLLLTNTIQQLSKKKDFVGLKKISTEDTFVENFKNNYLEENNLIIDNPYDRISSLFPSVTKEGFIMARHVCDKKSNNFWQHSYDCIRQFYPESNILIIDDNSNYDFITYKELDKSTLVIQSEFPCRGELLPYYYYSRLGNKFCEVAMCMHDSMFITAHIDIAAVEKYKILWDIGCHNGDNLGDEERIIGVYKDPDLTKFYRNKNQWTGCFGAASIVNYDFLMTINNKHDIRDMLDKINCRVHRQSFERVWGAILQYHHNCPYKEKVLIGPILKMCAWLTGWDNRNEHKRHPITKIWHGR